MADLDWDSLSESAQRELYGKAWRSLVLPLGDAEWAKLSPQEQAEVDLLIWAGCGMHKGLNASKGGCDGVSIMYRILGIDGPVPLPNKANAAASARGSPGDRAHAQAASTGGAVKLIELCGSVFYNKSEKQGQQNVYKAFFEVCHGLSDICLRYLHPYRMCLARSTLFQQ
jgi:hypothetical protein